MVASECSTTTAAQEAARIAFELAAHAEYSQKMIFRDADFADINSAVDAAQEARRKSGTPIEYHTVRVAVRNSIHELVVDADSVNWPTDDGIVTVVVTTASTYSLETQAFEYSVEGAIRRSIDDAAQINGVHVNEIIHVIDDEPAGA